MKCLVTGATGFIGSALAERLEARGLSVERCGREAPAQAQLNAAGILFHCAGIAHRSASDAEYESSNYRTTLTLAERAAAAGVRRFVFLSSVNAADADDAYGHWKQRTESALVEAWRGSAMGVVILRPALVYGAGARGNLGRLISLVKKGMPTPPPGQPRSMIGLPDLCEALCLLTEVDPGHGRLLIATDGESYTLARLHGAIARALGRHPGTARFPTWCWRLACAAADLFGGRPGSGQTWRRLFGGREYSAALLEGICFVVALVACGCYLRLARRWRLLDVPNHRSAHTTPVPRGGGVGIFLGLFAALGFAQISGAAWPTPYLAITGLAALLMLMGIMDDRYGLPVALRLVAYAATSSLALWLVLGSVPLWLQGLALLYTLWVLNLFNFMDGIDGIAGSEAAFVLSASAVLALWTGGQGAFPLYCLVLAAGCLAFLHWNWAPARVFMGDAGSIPLGFLLALLSLQGEVSGDLPLVASLVLLAAFIADATWTLAWRAWHREKLTEAHSRHLYQRLARFWGGHAPVVRALLAYNLLWLLPLAAAATLLPGYYWLWLPLAYGPLLPVLLKAGKLP